MPQFQERYVFLRLGKRSWTRRGLQSEKSGRIEGTAAMIVTVLNVSKTMRRSERRYSGRLTIFNALAGWSLEEAEEFYRYIDLDKR